MPFPLLIPLLISAGTQVYGAIQGKQAVDKASKQHQQGVKDAIAYMEPRYQQALEIAAQQAAQGQARLDPYSRTGTAGLSALSSLLGVPVPAATTAAMPAAAPAMAPAMPAAAAASPTPTLTALSSALAGAGRATGSSYAPPMGGTVRLRAPTGQIAEVPAHQVELFLAQGATRV